MLKKSLDLKFIRLLVLKKIASLRLGNPLTHIVSPVIDGGMGVGFVLHASF